MTEITYYDHNNEANKCIECFSEDIYHDEAFGFYKCRACRAMWGFDEDDPDYDEIALEIISAADF